MAHPELPHLELLAEVDALAEALQRWADGAPHWEPARTCRALVHRLVERTGSIRVRLEAPLVVATLGGTGTGKSALVNALVGAEVARTGRSRPTTRRPLLICRPDLSPSQLGIEPGSVDLVQRNAPALADLVLIDCPDPDTTELPESAGTNLARLRHILTHCDVLLVTSTQQKYRSARVADELAAAASGARLVFVQTHADVDPDIREDWSKVLGDHYAPGHIFRVDSLGALADAQNGVEARGEFAGLRDLLTRQMAGAAAARIRRANLVDLAEEALGACRAKIDQAMPAVEQLEIAIQQQRGRLAARLATQVRDELLASRRQWESRLVGQIASRWGFSPFALLLRVFHGLGGLVSGAWLMRVRTPAQVALWGAVQGARRWQQFRLQRRADALAAGAAAACWDQAELRSAALVIDGYTAEAGLQREPAGLEAITPEAANAAATFAAGMAAELEGLLARAAQRHTGWFTRWRYELMLLAVAGALGYRLGKNFFYDSWLAPQPVAPYGLEFYAAAACWLLLWCVLLLWAFTSRLRRGLRRDIEQLAERWNRPQAVFGVFARLETDCQRVVRFRQDLERLQQHVAALRSRLALADGALGHAKPDAPARTQP